jgi:hypothetical protein
VECITGVFVHQDIVQDPEVQRKKEFFYASIAHQLQELSAMPQLETISAHCAEILRQVKNSDVQPGGWVGGDAWFGSIQSCVEVYRRFGVHSTFVMKNNNKYFPTLPLRAVLTARHGTRPAGHWVVMTAEISGVPLLALVYAWSQSSVAYFISTCGSTQPHPKKYESKFEDEWGGTSVRLIDRPDIAHWYYHFNSLIDETNKQRQGILRLEQRWQTKDPYMRLVSTLLGQSVVDMHRYFRYWKIMVKGESHTKVDQIGIIKFTDLICGTMKPWPPRMSSTGAGRKRGSIEDGTEAANLLVRIQKADGSSNYAMTEGQEKRGKTVGNNVVWTCFMCRKYQDNDDQTIRHPTTWKCTHCGMPLCNAKRAGTNGRIHNCADDHILTDEPMFACNGNYYIGKAVPKANQINLNTRKSKRARTGVFLLLLLWVHLLSELLTKNA